MIVKDLIALVSLNSFGYFVLMVGGFLKFMSSGQSLV